MVKIALAVMCANFVNLEHNIRNKDRVGIEILYVDIMNGHIVSNL